MGIKIKVPVSRVFKNLLKSFPGHLFRQVFYPPLQGMCIQGCSWHILWGVRLYREKIEIVLMVKHSIHQLYLIPREKISSKNCAFGMKRNCIQR